MARNFPDWIKAYVDFTAVSEAPLEFHFWTAISTIAAVLRRRVWRDELTFKWTPNFYIIFVGPAGVVNKSTTLNIGYQILRNVPGIHFGPDSMTWHGLAKRFEAAFEYAALIRPNQPDITVPMSPLTCSVSELGTFLRPDDKGLVSFLTDVWDGKDRPFEHGTKDSGQIKIENPWLNIIGATTPEWMQTNFPPGLLREGIGSRTIFIHADKKRHLTAYPSRVVKPSGYKDVEKKLTEDLEHISKLIGPFDLTDEAFAWGENWYASHLGSRPLHMASSRYSGYLARKQTHMHKLAMILATAQRDNLVIEKADLEAANTILSTAEYSMIRVFESVGTVDEAKFVAELVAFVRAYKWITPNDLWRHCYNIMSKKDFSSALQIGIEGDLIEFTSKSGVKGLSPKAKRTN